MAEQCYPKSFDLRDPEIRFDRVAESYGVEGVRVERPEEIGPALDRMLADDRPFLIDLLVTDRVPGTLIGCRCGQ